jgi:hypothetical protein
MTEKRELSSIDVMRKSVLRWPASILPRLVLLLACCLVGASPVVAVGQDRTPRDQTANEFKQAARAAYHEADVKQGAEHLAKLRDFYKAEFAANPSWRGEYQWSRRLAEVALEYLRAGQLNDALVILGEAADLDAPLRKGLNNGLASSVGGLNRHLAALDSGERYELLHAWSMPSESHRSVRVLESFAPTTSPPPVFAKAFGERPRDSSFAIARVGQVSGLFSTAWELVIAADETGRLRRLRSELEELAHAKVANASHVLRLASIVDAKRRDSTLDEQLQKHFSRLRDNQARSERRSDAFDQAWQYGHGTFDAETQRPADFTLFPHWTGAAWQVNGARPDGNLGFIRIDQAGGHPSGPRASIRRWTAPQDGMLAIAGTMYHPTKEGDGVRGRIVSSRGGLLGEFIAYDSSTESKVEAVEVEAGETIDFQIDAIDNTFFDTTIWMVQLRLKSPDGERIYDSVADFCGPHDKCVMSDAVLAAACLQRDWLQPIGESILAKLIANTYESDKWINRPHEYRSPVIRPVLRRAWAMAVGKRNGEASFELPKDGGLRHWISAGRGIASASTRNTWFSHEDHVMHLAGSGDDLLFFKYPLTGDYEFTVETQTGGRPGTDGGVVLVGPGFDISLANPTPNPRPMPTDGHFVGDPEFTRFTISSAAGRAKLSSGGRIIWASESIASSLPWIALTASGDRNPIFRNLKLSGAASIPRLVKMTDGDSLAGWTQRRIAEQYAGMPLERPEESENNRVANANFRIPYFLANDELLASFVFGHQQASVIPRWSAANGVIQSQRHAGGQSVAQRHLYYQRPLLAGESVEYDFLYEPNKHAVHPALGRLAFLIEPDGVRLHWITDDDLEWTGLAEDNAVVEPFERRGPRSLPLKAGEWNRMLVRLNSDRVTLSLNDQEIYGRKLDAADDRTFGLYHDAQRSAANVRNVVMRGDWPEQLDDEVLSNLAAPDDSSANKGDQLALSRIIGEHHVSQNVIELARKSATLPEDARYKLLTDWVLPGDDHTTLRATAAFGPLNPPPISYLYTEVSTSEPSSRVQSGSQLVSPALELVRVAKKLGRLERLREVIGAVDESEQKRSREAMLCLIDITERKWEAANAHLARLLEVSGNVHDPAERWPEMLAVDQGLRHEETFDEARELVGALYGQLDRNAENVNPTALERHIWVLGNETLHPQAKERVKSPSSSHDASRQWVPVSRYTAKSRGSGFPPAHWHVSPKQFDHLGGHVVDCVYFQSPLRGNYSINCDVTSFSWRETHLAAAGLWFAPYHTHDKYIFGNLRESRITGTHRDIVPRLTDTHAWINYRIDVSDRQLKAFFNGRKVHEQELPTDHDPWLAIHSGWLFNGSVRDLRIVGEPEIPGEIRLAERAGLSGWLPYFDETVSDDAENANWRLADGELVGRQRDESLESLLQYHRPMLEDGTIEYEFYYKSDTTAVHPALDRLAFLMEPDGVRVHWSTDGIHDRSHLDPLNAAVEPENRRGPTSLPLKVEDWNRLRLTLAGDVVTIELNGKAVYERQLEATNMRTFGLFHYANQTEVRVRNIVWRGDWPRELPKLDEQELADVALIAKLDSKLPELSARFEHDFSKALPIPILRQVGTARVWENGLHVSRARPGNNNYFRISNGFRIVGDFDITASFDDLELEVVDDPATGAHVSLLTRFNTPQRDEVFIVRNIHHSGAHKLDVAHHRNKPDGTRNGPWVDSVHDGPAGTFRIARRGETIHLLFADGDSDQFRQLDQYKVTTDDVDLDGLHLTTQVFGKGGSINATWKRLTIRAEEISGLPAEIAAQRKATVERFTRQLTGPLPTTALRFDGRKSHVRIPTLTIDGSSPVTYEAFATPDALNNSIIIGDTQRGGAGLAVNGAYNLHIWDGAVYRVAVGDRPAMRFMRVHLAATMNRGQLRLFVDGKEQRQRGQFEKFVASKLPLVVGASPSARAPAIDGQFNGVIDAIRITKGVRYSEDFAPPAELKADKNTVVCLRFDEGEGTKAVDSSQNAHHGVIQDAEWVGDDALRWRAAQSLARIGPDGIAVLTSSLKSKNSDIKFFSIRALASAGERAAVAVPALEALSKDNDPRINGAAKQALSNIQGTGLLKSLLNLFK